MLLIQTFCLGDYQTNCYLIQDRACTRCCLIDPGYESERILHYIEKSGLTLDAILLTHGHFDHVGAVRDIAAETDCKVYINEKETTMPPAMTAGKLYYTDTYAEGDHLVFPGLKIDVIETPGHTPGSVCLLVEDAMFSGDTLFAGSCGRTDLPGGEPTAMVRSLWRLSGLGKDYRVFPGHGRATSLNAEKAYNPYMK